MSLLAAAATALTITVRVYDLYGLSSEERARALAIAGETLARAHVSVVWQDCHRDPQKVLPPACVEVSAKTGLPMSLILGRVTAHEIGHLLLGTNSHTLSGLMQAKWDLRRPQPAEWRFTSADAEKIRDRRLARREGEVATADE